MNAVVCKVERNPGEYEAYGFVCTKCERVYTKKIYCGRGALEQARKGAEACCAPRLCEDCGVETRPDEYRIVCRTCEGKRRATRLLERLREVKTISVEDYEANPPGGSVAYAAEWNDDTLFFDFESAADAWATCHEDAPEVPLLAWLWACEPYTAEVDIDAALESAWERAEVNETTDREFHNEQELRDFVEAWNKRNHVKLWHQDSKLVVVLDAVEFRKILDGERAP